MKRMLFMATCFLLGYFTSYAQTEKGTTFIGGNVAYSSQKTTGSYYDNSMQLLSIQPSIGWFLSSNLALGVSPMLSYTKQNDNQVNIISYNSTNTLLGGGVFLRYYFMFNQSVGLYPEFAADYLAGVNSNNHSNSFETMIRPNLVFFPIKKLGLNLGFSGIAYTHHKQTDGAKTNSFGVYANGNNLVVGLSYYLAK